MSTPIIPVAASLLSFPEHFDTNKVSDVLWNEVVRNLKTYYNLVARENDSAWMALRIPETAISMLKKSE